MAKKKDFWNEQYSKPTHLELSDEPAEDLQKFCRHLERTSGREFLQVTTRAVDIGCGNGRNLVWLAKTYGVHGLGYDASSVAIDDARKASHALYEEQVATGYVGPERLNFIVQNMNKPIPLGDASCAIALDMMASHVLKSAEREALMYEILRVLKPNGWLFFKTFILEEDLIAARMLREFPADEPGMYVHPEIGIPEYVWTVPEIKRQFGDYFDIVKIEKSFKHKHADGRAWKRRTACVYLQKNS